MSGSAILAGLYESSPSSYTSGQADVPVHVNINGALHVVGAANSGVDIGDVTLTAGTNYVGQFASPIQYVTVSMTTPTGALAIGDVVADTQVVTNATRAIDTPAILESVSLIDTDDQKALLNLVFFSSNVSLGAEDAAPDIDDTEALSLLGRISIIAADWSDLGGAAIATLRGQGLVVQPATGTRDIYMAIYVPATSTPTYASGIITVRLGFRSM